MSLITTADVPAIFAGCPFAPEVTSYLCNLSLVSTDETPNWLVDGATTLEMEPFISNCTSPIVASTQPELVELVRNGTASFGVGLANDVPAETVEYVRPFFATRGGTPVGIIVREDARQEDPQLVDSLQAGLVSMMWSGNSSVIHQIDAAVGRRMPDSLAYPTAAITGFLTKNGQALSWGETPIAQGPLETPPPPPVNVTLAVYRGNTLPLASIEGASIDEWSGIEVEMIKSLCRTPGPLNCSTDILIANTVDERLTLLDERADISIGSIVVNQNRLDSYSFVQPFYFSAGPALYVTKENEAAYPEDATLDVMKGETVCTVTNSAQNPAGEAYGANLLAFNSRDEAVANVEAGNCIGLLWVSHVAFMDPVLIEVASDPAMSDPIGIAVSQRLPIGAYSFISAVSAQWMAKGRESDLLRWESTYQGMATKNEELKAVVNAITNFVPPDVIVLKPDGDDISDDISDDIITDVGRDSAAESATGFAPFGLAVMAVVFGL